MIRGEGDPIRRVGRAVGGVFETNETPLSETDSAESGYFAQAFQAAVIDDLAKERASRASVASNARS